LLIDKKLDDNEMRLDGKDNEKEPKTSAVNVKQGA
jgi:hypothetical protein